MTESFREEFRVAKFGLQYPFRKPFDSAQWRWPPVIFTIYRIVLPLYVASWYITLMVITKGRSGIHSSYAYLTIWSYTILLIHLIWAFGVNLVSIWIKRHRSNSSMSLHIDTKDGADNYAFQYDATAETSSGCQNTESVTKSNTWYMKVSWVLFSNSSVAAIIVTAIYFSALYSLTGQTHLDPFDFNLHGVNSIIMILEHCIAGYPIRLLHLIYPLIYGAIYIIFSAIYWSFDHKNNVLYPGVLDWNHPGSTMLVLCILVFLVVPILQLIFYGIHRLKLWLHLKIHSRPYF
ncbi:unnamed protein product [Owenia fusiformis]|uniref:Uncharacterized protein n=1 Tax=Owenia fusiformis TaxID=6347 RepID=A0A8J1UF90_OWEFU|nr:unnamed protein product [Owenia fusiformis]